jgi:hypothetical protein
MQLLKEVREFFFRVGLLSRIAAEAFGTSALRTFAPRRLPGWLASGLGAGSRFAEWNEHIRSIYDLAREIGHEPALFVNIISSPAFSLSLIVGGLLYVFLVGEPSRGVKRHPAWPIVGWSTVSICFAAVIFGGLYTASEMIYVAGEGQGERKVQQQSLGAPVYWHMTDDEKTRLGAALDKIKPEDRFEFVVWCSMETNSRTYTEDFLGVFTAHDWKPKPNCLFNSLKAGITGQYIAIPAANKDKQFSDLPAHTQSMAKILADAQLPFQWSLETTPEMFKDQDFVIVIGVGPKAVQ